LTAFINRGRKTSKPKADGNTATGTKAVPAKNGNQKKAAAAPSGFEPLFKSKKPEATKVSQK